MRRPQDVERAESSAPRFCIYLVAFRCRRSKVLLIMKRTKFLSIIGLVGLALVSCLKTESAEDSQYVSVQLEDSKMWSLLDVTSGQIVMSDEFFAPSSNVVNGSFFVENDNQEFDLYNLKDTKNKLNRNSYSTVSNFNKDGFAITRVKDEPWQIIDTEGKVIATLDKNLMVLSGFSDEGMALIKNADNMMGYVNVQGQNTIKPRYKYATIFSDGIAFVLTKEEENHNYLSAIDPTGNILFTFSDAKYSEIGLFNQGYAFAVEGDHSVLLDKTGKKVMTVCNDTNISNLSYHDGKVIYYDGQYYGVKSLEDKILIRAKYQSLRFQSDGKLVAKNTNDKYGVITFEDDLYVPFDYDELVYIAPDRYITKPGNVYVMINEKGKEICDKAFDNFYNRSESSSEIGQIALISSSNNSGEEQNDMDNFLLNLFNLDDSDSTANLSSFSQDQSDIRLPNSGSLDQFSSLSYQMLLPEDLRTYSLPELRILRNAIFARHGYIFKSEDLKYYFSNFYDYNPYTRNVSDFNSIELANIDLIKRYE